MVDSKWDARLVFDNILEKCIHALEWRELHVPGDENSSNDYLVQAYERLGYIGTKSFYDLSDFWPGGVPIQHAHWIDVAHRMGARAVYFAGDYPVIFFYQFDVLNEEELFRLQRKMWNMSKVPLFFVALPGELRVYSAYHQPVRDVELWLAEPRWLERVHNIQMIAEALRYYRRFEIETEEIFRGSKVGSHRADAWLLKNLRLVRTRLEEAGLDRKTCHALIGRSIFIRYLEDRRVLVEDYFASVDGSSRNFKRYIDVLESKQGTYRLFEMLRKDFNGDMFPMTEGEQQSVSEHHLNLLRDFLMGQRMDEKQDLFFWAYEFDVIPVELLSNIYEEFYHTGDRDQKGTHYTPATLVEFVLANGLTKDKLLQRDVRIIDPACGSGIFLVEAFRRIVRTRNWYEEDKPSYPTMVQVLENNLVGVDINEEALRVAAFSLYLALLDFMEPADIRQHRLPKLIYNPDLPREGGRTLYHINAFDATDDPPDATAQYSSQPGLGQFDVVLGNPPWGQAPNDPDGRRAVAWCRSKNYPVGDKELSQCFLWLASELLKPEGNIALIVSSGLFFKHHKNSVAFRDLWLKTTKINAVYNFAHVRDLFFKGQARAAISPFAVVFCTKPTHPHGKEILENTVYYASARRSSLVERLQAVAIDKTSSRHVKQAQFIADHSLWKVFLWGGPSDYALLTELRAYESLGEICAQRNWLSGQGFTPGDGLAANPRLSSFPLINNNAFVNRFEPVPLQALQETPTRVHRPGNLSLFDSGLRLIVKQGISQTREGKGEIVARLESEPMCFTNTIMAIRMDDCEDWEAKSILAILWSSLAKYFHFMTGSAWGLWHDQIHKSEHLNLPVRFPTGELRSRIVHIVDRLLSAHDSLIPVPSDELLSELNECVYDLFELSMDQIELIEDFGTYIIDLYYRRTGSVAVARTDGDMIGQYAKTFKDVWDERLGSRNLTLLPTLYRFEEGSGLIGMSFILVPSKNIDIALMGERRPVWDELGEALQKNLGGDIYSERSLKLILDREFILIKRDERFLWTKSRAREDAFELLVDIYKREWSQENWH